MTDLKVCDLVTIESDIKRYRAQMLIHSYLYYVKDRSIISDHEFDRRAKKLADLQKELGTHKIDFYDDLFEGWTGASGYHLKYDSWSVSKALYVERIHSERIQAQSRQDS